MKACNTSTYLIGNKRISQGISKRISSLLLLLTCALTLAACGGGGGSGGTTNPGGTTDVGLIRYCDFDTTARYTVNNVLPLMNIAQQNVNSSCRVCSNYCHHSKESNA